MTIDLTACVPGQKLRLRNGEIAIYAGLGGMARWPHRARSVENPIRMMNFQSNGMWFSDESKDDEDVVEILPFEPLCDISPFLDPRLGKPWQSEPNPVFTAKISADRVETNGTGFWAVYQGETDDH